MEKSRNITARRKEGRVQLRSLGQQGILLDSRYMDEEKEDSFRHFTTQYKTERITSIE